MKKPTLDKIVKKTASIAAKATGAFVAVNGVDLMLYSYYASSARVGVAGLNPFVRFLGQLTLTGRALDEKIGLTIYKHLSEEQIQDNYWYGAAALAAGLVIYNAEHIINGAKKGVTYLKNKYRSRRK